MARQRIAPGETGANPDVGGQAGAGRRSSRGETPVVQAARPTRAFAVDALRGLAFLGVVLGEAKPYEVLPAWMYHAQEPPPTHMIDPDLAGLTFPDLVFPFFIFTMGVAIPLALTRRLERGAGYGSILRRGVIGRFLLLMFLALFRQHFDSGAFDAISPAIHHPERYAWMLGLMAFAVLFAIFTRLPEGWSRSWRIGVRTAGWSAAILMFWFTRFADGSHIRFNQVDDILVINAYCMALGTLVWLATRRNPMGRLAVLALIVAVRLNDGHDGWLDTLFNFEPDKALYDFSFLEYLCIAIPGTIVGDLLVDWTRAHLGESGGRASLFSNAGVVRVDVPPREWSNRHVVAIAGILLCCVPLLLTGIEGRYVFATTAIAAALCAAACYLSRNGADPTEVLIAQLVRWGSFWLLLGLLLDPFEGGTKKEPPTFAWFFQGAGLAIFVLVAFFIIINVLKRRRWLQILIDNGQNPMMGYVAYGMVALPILGLTGIKSLFEGSEPPPWLAFAWGLMITVAVAYFVRFFSRRKLYWRS